MICSSCGASVGEEDVGYKGGSSYCPTCMGRLIKQGKEVRKSTERDFAMMNLGLVVFGTGVSLFMLLCLGMAIWTWIKGYG